MCGYNSMGSSTSSLQDYMNRKTRNGLHFSDIYNLPTHQYTIIELLKDKKELAYEDLCQQAQSLPEDKRLTQSQVDGTLYELIRVGYVTSFMDDGTVFYMIQTQKPQKRDEQRLWKKLDLGDLDIDDLGKA